MAASLRRSARIKELSEKKKMDADESLKRAGKQDKMQQNGSKLGRSRKVNDSKGQVSKPPPKSRTQNVINPRSKKRMTKPAQSTTSARSRIVEVTKENTLRLPLCRAALQALEAQTANHPLPKGLETWRVESSAQNFGNQIVTSSESVDVISLYSQKFANRLEAQGILGHHFLENKTKLRVPDNFETIKSFIQKPRKSPEPTEHDYKKYAETLFRAGSCENKIYTLFNMFFDVPTLLKNGHLREIQQKWTKIFPIGTQDIEHRPRPGYAEGLKTSNLPQWVRTRLGSLITFNEQINLPNFIVEMKREGSQLKAHQQNIYSGAFSSQAYHSYYEHILRTPNESWDMAKVGTLVFDGDTVVGNVHWVSKSPDNEIRDREFLVARVFCHFTLGTGLEDFRTARRSARNFRDYFRRVRSDLRRECAELINPAAPKDESDGLSSFTSSGS